MVASSIAFILGVFFGVLLVILFAPMPHLSKSHNSPSIHLPNKEETMKLYHTETQEEYNALMAYVEKKGYEWNTKEKPTEYNCWNIFKKETVIVIEYDINLGFASKEYFERVYPDTPIKKYKVKQDEVAKWFDGAANAMKAFASNGVSMKKTKY